MSDQLAIDFAAPAARRTDPETSHGAAVIALHRASAHRRLAFDTIAAAGANGLTDFELAEKTGVAQTSIGKRRGDLEKAGLVEVLLEACAPSTRWPLGVRPVTRLSPSNTPARVYVLTYDGRAAAADLAKAGAA